MANTSIATVTPNASNSKQATIAITGVGTTTVTATANAIVKTITVEGTIKALVITAPEGATYQVGDVIQLTATPDPASQVSVVWSSNNEAVATVDQTGKVTIKAKGSAEISATSGTVVGKFPIISIDLLDLAAGYWEFDEAGNLGKATKGFDLTLRGGEIVSVAGPSASNLAISAPLHQYLECDHGLPTNGGEPTTQVNEYTLLYDVSVPYVRNYYSLFWDGSYSDGGIFLRQREGSYQAGVGAYPVLTNVELPANEGDMSRWFRLIVVKESNKNLYFYVDGVRIESEASWGAGNEGRVSLPVGAPIYFFADAGGDSSDDDYPFPCAAIALWDRALTAGEIQTLGGIGH
ncbi:MAG: Ig-like domain-containing protein [Tannerella sp.]|jgi:hypothetical protein|nr:Ig-like domain-containing protein [Tannerella sp.]